MKKYYPIIFTKEEIGFSTAAVNFEGCFSEGDTFEEAYVNTQDALGLYLEDASDINLPVDIDVMSNLSDNQFVCVVEFDDMEYKKKHSSRSVKKTLTIPEWLNAEAEKQHINFSGVLQEALKSKLNITA
ncbi:MAG: type II toxin-antitoxin system HicB family antitoxin [Faecalibacterium sp.]|nr:type II toxin-antitoxin system HicB family antitoxin [Ruminococcus sp.]MCM1392109.1 type II toxin-antitoxin system HicB family antitoxin [Ruminococcus sp.]MCM1485806.1 type II toxin-antitoxin system HicB family antitoxin [Faecalibacterium sp.]